MNSKNKVYIFDTTLRDGEQVPGCQLNTVEKIQLAKALEGLGVDVIEAGFPVSSPGDFNSVREISKAVTWPTICALTRAVEKDIDVAADALKYAKRKRITPESEPPTIAFATNSTPTKEILERAVQCCQVCEEYVEDVEFAEDAGRTDNAYQRGGGSGHQGRSDRREHPRHDRLPARGIRSQISTFSTMWTASKTIISRTATTTSGWPPPTRWRASCTEPGR